MSPSVVSNTAVARAVIPVPLKIGKFKLLRPLQWLFLHQFRFSREASVIIGYLSNPKLHSRLIFTPLAALSVAKVVAVGGRENTAVISYNESYSNEVYMSNLSSIP